MTVPTEGSLLGLYLHSCVCACIYLLRHLLSSHLPASGFHFHLSIHLFYFWTWLVGQYHYLRSWAWKMCETQPITWTSDSLGSNSDSSPSPTHSSVDRSLDRHLLKTCRPGAVLGTEPNICILIFFSTFFLTQCLTHSCAKHRCRNKPSSIWGLAGVHLCVWLF